MSIEKDTEIKSRYEDYSVEELKEALSAIFNSTDEFSDSDVEQMDEIMAVLNRRNPLPRRYSAEESLKHFRENYSEELSRLGVRNTGEVMEERAVADADVVRIVSEKEASHPARLRKVFRVGLIAAVMSMVILAAAVTASAMGCDLFGWVPRWNGEAFTFGRESPEPNEMSDSSPIAVTLEQLDIHEPLYPTWLPDGFILKTSVIETDPVFLHEIYYCDDRHISITIQSASHFDTGIYQKDDTPPYEYYVEDHLHYIVADKSQYSATWECNGFDVLLMGNVTFEELKQIINSVYKGAS